MDLVPSYSVITHARSLFLCYLPSHAPAGESLKEANFINKSLSFLKQVVNALARNDAYIPFR